MFKAIYSILQHECQTRATRLGHERHEWDTNETWVQHEGNTNGTSATRVTNFDFDNDTSENIFSLPYISYIANERLQGEKQFHSKKYLLEMTHPDTKMRLKSALQNLNFVMGNIKKVISRTYTLDCSYNCNKNHFMWN